MLSLLYVFEPICIIVHSDDCWCKLLLRGAGHFYAAFCMCITIINKSFVISRFVKRPMSVYFLLCWQAVNSFSSLHVRCICKKINWNSFCCWEKFPVHSWSLSHTTIISIFNNSYVFISNSSSKPRMFILCHHNMHAWDFSLERDLARTKEQ